MKCGKVIFFAAATFVAVASVSIAPYVYFQLQKAAVQNAIRGRIAKLSRVSKDEAHLKFEIEYEADRVPWFLWSTAPQYVEVANSSLPWPFPDFDEFEMRDQFGQEMANNEAGYPCLYRDASTSRGPKWQGEVVIPLSKTSDASRPMHATGSFQLYVRWKGVAEFQPVIVKFAK